MYHPKNVFHYIFMFLHLYINVPIYILIIFFRNVLIYCFFFFFFFNCQQCSVILSCPTQTLAWLKNKWAMIYNSCCCLLCSTDLWFRSACLKIQKRTQSTTLKKQNMENIMENIPCYTCSPNNRFFSFTPLSFSTLSIYSMILLFLTVYV